MRIFYLWCMPSLSYGIVPPTRGAMRPFRMLILVSMLRWKPTRFSDIRGQVLLQLPEALCMVGGGTQGNRGIMECSACGCEESSKGLLLSRALLVLPVPHHLLFALSSPHPSPLLSPMYGVSFRIWRIAL